jgi:superfamily II DNA or RNA helicase
MVAKAHELVEAAGSRLEVTDRRSDPGSIAVRFTAALRDRQPDAVAALTGHELGVLEAPPGAGKTVMGCALIAHHRVPTLVLVDRAPLLAQWRERITAVLDIDPSRVGQIGGGKTRLTGIIDLAMLQTVSRMDDAGTRLSGYGLVIVDGCIMPGAPTVEKAVRRIPARRWVGLTATAYRRDGLGPVIFMHCGPKRYVIPLVDAADPAPLQRCLHAHTTSFTLTEGADTAKPGAITSTVFGGLVADDTRNDQVCADVHDAVVRGRNCLVLTRRTAHVETLAARLCMLGHDPKLLYATRKAAELRLPRTGHAVPGPSGVVQRQHGPVRRADPAHPPRQDHRRGPRLRRRRGRRPRRDVATAVTLVHPARLHHRRGNVESHPAAADLSGRDGPYRPLRRSSARKLRLRRLVSFSAVT